MKIANIITNEIVTDYPTIFNVCNTLNEKIQGIPTLIIGWKLMKRCFKDADILCKEYKKDEIYWTFTQVERKCDYDIDVEDFYKVVLNNTLNNVRYIYVDILNYSYTKIKKIINFLKNKEVYKLLYFTKDKNFMFIYSPQYNTVFGVSLSLCEYIGVSKNKVIRLLNNCELITKLDNINPKLKKVVGNDTHKLLPLYYFFKL